ncbi:hypothetical protein RIR_jg27271.t1 [Rhizophagus irregularis DAOM 181602=DAOM 197198]|nr:hypothetical protein RIR_jg27271.t1 [Rhizophagus irregularis DAOM 181602=DAOM 197198]
MGHATEFYWNGRSALNFRFRIETFPLGFGLPYWDVSDQNFGFGLRKGTFLDQDFERHILTPDFDLDFEIGGICLSLQKSKKEMLNQ